MMTLSEVVRFYAVTGIEIREAIADGKLKRHRDYCMVPINHFRQMVFTNTGVSRLNKLYNRRDNGKAETKEAELQESL